MVSVVMVTMEPKHRDSKPTLYWRPQEVSIVLIWQKKLLNLWTDFKEFKNFSGNTDNAIQKGLEPLL